MAVRRWMFWARCDPHHRRRGVGCELEAQAVFFAKVGELLDELHATARFDLAVVSIDVVGRDERAQFKPRRAA